jgi:TolB-like protein
MRPHLFLLALLAAAPALAEKRLAVLEFRNKVQGSDRQKVDAGYFTDQVRAAALAEIPGLQVMTRENLVSLLEASGKKLEDCEGECEVDTGRRLAADLVVSGELLRIGSNFKLNMRLHETQTGWLLSASVASGKTVDELDGSAPQAVSKLMTPVKARPTAAVDPTDLLKDPFAEYEVAKKSGKAQPPGHDIEPEPVAAASPVVPQQRSPFCSDVARIASAAPGAFESLKAGNLRVNGDGDKVWDSQIALLANQPCAIWAYADAKLAPAQRCKMVDLGPCAETQARFRDTTSDLRGCLGSGWRASEDKSADGVVKEELRIKGTVVRLELVPYDFGRCDINLSVEAR